MEKNKNDSQSEKPEVPGTGAVSPEEPKSPWHVIPRADWSRDERGVVNVKCPQCGTNFALDAYSIIFDGLLVHTFDAQAKDTVPETATLKHECGYDQLAALGGFEGI